VTGWNAVLIKAAVVIKMVNMLTVGFAQTMMALNQTLKEQLNQYNILVLTKGQAIHQEYAFTHALFNNERQMRKNSDALAKHTFSMAGFAWASESANITTEVQILTQKQAKIAQENTTLATERGTIGLQGYQLQMAQGKSAVDMYTLTLNMLATGFQMVASAIMSAVTMGMMFATMDFSGPMKNLLRLIAITNATKAGLLSFTPVQAVGAAAAAGLAMGGIMYKVAKETKGNWSAQTAGIGTELATLEAQYAAEYSAAVPSADTGMFARRTYDEGGTIGPRHQLVYVEPGEQIISKTQGMVGMGGGITVNVGDVYAQDGTDFAEKLASALPIALRNVSYRGAF